MVRQGIRTSSFSSSLTTPAGLTVVVIAMLGVFDFFDGEYFVLGRDLVKIANLRDWKLVNKQSDSALYTFWKEVD